MLDLVSGRVMVFGTFDVLHQGHKFFIGEAMKKCKIENEKCKKEDLFIVIARDKTVRKLKGGSRNSEEQRRREIQKTFPKARVILGDEQDPMWVVRKFKPRLICLGYDQVGFSESLMSMFPEIEIVRIKSYKPEKYKSSLVP